MKYKVWTCEEDAKLIKSHEQGKDIGMIALEHERSRGAIETRLAKHYFHKNWTDKCLSKDLNLTQSDADHLSWIYERMAHVHKENQQVDYMLRFRKIICTMKTVLS